MSTKRKSGAVICDTNHTMDVSVMPNKAYVLHEITWPRKREDINRCMVKFVNQSIIEFFTALVEDYKYKVLRFVYSISL